MTAIDFAAFGTDRGASLAALRAINAQIGQFQRQLATGKQVATAADNPGVFAQAALLDTDASGLDAIVQTLAVNRATIAGAAGAGSQVLGLLNELRNTVIAAQDSGADRTSLQTIADGLLAQVDSLVSASSINGVNLLSGGTSLAVLTGLVTDGRGSIQKTEATITGRDLRISDPSGELNALDDLDLSNDSAAAAALTAVDAAIATASGAVAQLGTDQRRLDIQSDFVSGLSAAIRGGISDLVDADLTSASVSLKAAEVQRELAINALQISSASQEALLKLFL